MRGEQAVDEADLEHDEQAKSDADHARGEPQAAIEVGESFSGKGKRGAQNHGDQHHACNRAQAEDQQVSDCPARIADGGQHQQGNGSRTRKPVYHSNGQRPQHLVKTEAGKQLLERPLRAFLKPKVGVRFVRMHMNVRFATMTMYVRMHDAGAVLRGEALGDPARDPGQVHNTENDQHQSHSKFHRKPNAGRNGKVEDDDAGADEDDRDGVTQAPERTNHSGMSNTLPPADNRRNCDDMIGIGRMPNAEHETNADDGEETDHGDARRMTAPSKPYAKVYTN